MPGTDYFGMSTEPLELGASDLDAGTITTVRIPDNTGLDTESDSDHRDTAEDIVIGTVAVPESFNGTPVLFSVLYFASSEMTGIPDGFAETSFDQEEIASGDTFPFSATQAGLTGDYYVAVTLYCEGGGNGRFPKPGVDWIGAASDGISLGPGTGTIDVGEIDLIPAEE